MKLKFKYNGVNNLKQDVGNLIQYGYIVNGSDNSNTLNIVWRYDDTDTWTVENHSSYADKRCITIGNGKYIMSVGGRVQGWHPAHDTTCKIDCVSKSSVITTNYPTLITQGGAYSYMDDIIIVCGNDDTNLLPNLNLSNINTISWVAKTNNPNVLDSNTTKNIDSIGYSFGGYDDSGITRLVNAYDIINDTFNTITMIPSAIQLGTSNVVDSDNILLTAGHNGSNATDINRVYNITNNNYITKTNLPITKYSGAGFVVNDKQHYIGGYAASNGNYEFDYSLNSWSLKAGSPGVIQDSIGAISTY
jgi:hypothetical protein